MWDSYVLHETDEQFIINSELEEKTMDLGTIDKYGKIRINIFG